MLVLSRKQGEWIQIGENCRVFVTTLKGNRVCLGIEAPPGVRVLRSELVQGDGRYPLPRDGMIGLAGQ